MPALRLTDGSKAERMVLPPGAPEPPSWLSEEARAEWARVVPHLDQLGVLAQVDRAVLVTYCSQWGQFVRAEQELQDDGLTSPRSDRPAKSPVWQIHCEAAAAVLSAARELYLTPAARLRALVPTASVASGDPDGILD